MLLKRVFPRIVEIFSDPRTDVKQSSAFGRFYYIRSNPTKRERQVGRSRVLDTSKVQAKLMIDKEKRPNNAFRTQTQIGSVMADFTSYHLIASDGQVRSQSGSCLWLVRRQSSTMQRLSRIDHTEIVLLVLNHRWLP